MKFFKLLLFPLLGMFVSCSKTDVKLDVKRELDYTVEQLQKTMLTQNDPNRSPRCIDADSTDWKTVSIQDWTTGFYPGILWYAYEYTKDKKIKEQAELYTQSLYPLLNKKPDNHDLGFMFYCSSGNAFRLTNDTVYKSAIIRSAELLAELYNPIVGTINSWPAMCAKQGWPHNTIIDNMINLELLFEVSKLTGDKKFHDIALSHATKTMNNHFRPDYTTPHVVVYDTITGKKIKMVTHQGYADNSTWARGQAWAIYGFTMAFRETGNVEFINTAMKAADWYLTHLPEDMIPYFDFDAVTLPNCPKDASAAAIVASGLIDLSTLLRDKALSQKYMDAAKKMLVSLSSEKYQSREKNNAFIMHSTGHYPNGTEIDASIIYADYYYIEALIRLWKLENTK